MPTEIPIDKHYALYFVAIVAHEPVAGEVMKIKHEFAEKYGSKKPLNSPPHITLITPLYFNDNSIELIEKPLREFSLLQKKFTIYLSGFGAFPPKTIFVDVKPNEDLRFLFDGLCDFVTKNINALIPYIPQKFTPHITVGNRDLTKGNFKKAWEVFEKKAFDKIVEVSNLTLLRHNGSHWETLFEFPFAINL